MPVVTPPSVETAVLPFTADAVWGRLRTGHLEALLPLEFSGSRPPASRRAASLGGREVTLASGESGRLRVTVVADDDMAIGWATEVDGVIRAKERVEVKAVTIAAGDSAVVTWTVTPGKGAASVAWPAKIRGRIAQLGRSLRSLPAVPYVVPKLSDDELALYYGAYPVMYAPVEGDVYPYTPGCLVQGDNTESARRAAQQRLQPVSALTGDATCEHLYQPAFPCVDPKADFDPSAVDTLPEELRKPLLKSRKGTIRGIRSGGRSGILIKGRTAYRLKGCGNYVDGSYGGKSLRFDEPGMPTAKMTKLDALTFDMDPDAFEVRGVAFPHACQRELLMSSEIARAIEPLHVPSALAPVGYAEYGFPGEPFPSLKKACGVFETLGERRVASHLLAGLEMLLPKIVRSVDKDALVSRFPEKRRGPIEFSLYDDDFNKTTKVYPVYPSHASDEWIDASTFPFEDAVPEEYPLPPLAGAEAPVKEVPGGEPDESNPHGNHDYRALWAATTAKYRSLLERLRPAESKAEDVEDSSVIAHLYWRVGREIGAVRRAMSDANISWGYYCDHSPEAVHNNSHPNNFVVLPPGERPGGALVAPLDFDMSYTKESHFFLPTGEIDEKEFTSSLGFEKRELRANLGGSEASTGLAGVDGSAALGDDYVAVRFALRDTLLCGFDTAHDLKVDPHPTSDLMAEATHTLATLALIAAAQQVS